MQAMDEAIAALVQENRNARADDVLRGAQLAKRWAAIEDAALKQAALEDISARWEDRGWWERPPRGVARTAKAIYLQAPAHD